VAVVTPIHIGVDPSVSCTGWCLFYGDELHRVEIARAPDIAKACARPHALDLWGDVELRPGTCTIELPQHYGSNSKADANDLIGIAAVAGAYAAVSPVPVTFVRPAQWKGQVSKTAMEARIIAALNETSRATAERMIGTMNKGLRNNAWDAIGIALYGMGKL
jgi:hypothetical protein